MGLKNEKYKLVRQSVQKKSKIERSVPYDNCGDMFKTKRGLCSHKRFCFLNRKKKKKQLVNTNK